MYPWPHFSAPRYNVTHQQTRIATKTISSTPLDANITQPTRLISNLWNARPERNPTATNNPFCREWISLPIQSQILWAVLCFCLISKYYNNWSKEVGWNAQSSKSFMVIVGGFGNTPELCGVNTRKAVWSRMRLYHIHYSTMKKEAVCTTTCRSIRPNVKYIFTSANLTDHKLNFRII